MQRYCPSPAGPRCIALLLKTNCTGLSRKATKSPSITSLSYQRWTPTIGAKLNPRAREKKGSEATAGGRTPSRTSKGRALT